MEKLVRWGGFAATLWVVACVGLTAVQFWYVPIVGSKDDLAMGYLHEAQLHLYSFGSIAVGIVSPVIQFALIIFVLLYVAKQAGIVSPDRTIADYVGAQGGFNVQAVIAIIVIGTFALSSLTGLGGHVTDLKDITLVVVGFYFGTHRRQGEVDAAAAAGTTARAP